MNMRNSILTTGIKKDALIMLALLISFAVVAPLVFREQLITGTIVNATLIIGASILGKTNGILIGLVPSTIALSTGIISPAMAPMIPFIIMGNAILVITFSYFGRFNFWLGAAVGSVLKFAFLYGMSNLVFNLIIEKKLAAAAAQTMSWPQLVTAAAGSIIAYGVLMILKKGDKATGTDKI
jgi:riboflavin transporter